MISSIIFSDPQVENYCHIRWLDFAMYGCTRSNPRTDGNTLWEGARKTVLCGNIVSLLGNEAEKKTTDNVFL
jgi:hypothetical protein